MSDLSEEIEQLNKKFYVAQERLKNSEKNMSDLYEELTVKYKVDPKILKDSKLMKDYVEKQQSKILLAEEKLIAEARGLNDRITLT